MTWFKEHFSNFNEMEKPIDFHGVKCYTVEAYYQACKASSIDEGRIIAVLPPGKAKRAGRVASIREDWPEIKVEVMTRALRHKYTSGTRAAEFLVQSHPRKLVETNYWHDNIWGDCTCSKCRSIQGTNLLGVFLMAIREELMGNADTTKRI